MKYIKAFCLAFGLMLVASISFISITNAQSFHAGETVIVGKSETIDSMLVAAGNSVNVAGIVNGDVYCAGQDITISGTVNGDVICVGFNVFVSGKINGDIRLAGQTVTVSGYVRGNASLASESLFLQNGGVITGDILGGAESANLDGSVGRDLAFASSSLLVNGEVGRDIKGNVESLTIGSSGLVKGNVDYSSFNDPVVLSGGEIKGSVTIYEPDERQSSFNQPSASMAFMGFVFFSASMLVVGVALAFLTPRVLDNAAQKSRKSPWSVIAAGLISLIVVPIGIIMLLVSVVGIPLAFIIGLLWMLTLALSAPFTGYALGYAIISQKTNQPSLIMLVGLSLLCLIFFIPLIGFFAVLVSAVFGGGMVLVGAKNIIGKAESSKSKSK